jgi:TonB family protein
MMFLIIPGALLSQHTIKVKKPVSDSIYPYDVAPEFPGGLICLYQYLRNGIKYPKISREEGFQKTVIVSFTIEMNGSITNVNSLTFDPVKVNGNDMDMEAVRVIQNMPKWKPAQLNGRSVKCSYSLPIKFSL